MEAKYCHTAKYPLSFRLSEHVKLAIFSERIILLLEGTVKLCVPHHFDTLKETMA